MAKLYVPANVEISGNLTAALNPFSTAYAGGAKGDGVTDDTAALTAWINAINATAGALAVLPTGQYMVSSPLPAITAPASSIRGAGWAQTANTDGSVITAAAGFTGTLFTLSAEGVQLDQLTLDGAGRASTVLAVTGGNCTLKNMQVRAAAANGVTVDIQAGGSTAWLANCRINGVNSGVTGVQVNDTDVIITACKPVNCQHGIVLLGGASGALIETCHITAGAGGLTGIYVNGGPSRVIIAGNRFDNFVASAIQLVAPASTPNDLTIANNDFYSTVQTDATYALIGIDTTNNSWRALKITDNNSFATGTNRPKYFLAAQTLAGAAASNPGNVASLGCLVSGNTAYVSSAFYGGSAAPTAGLANMVSTNGTTFSQVTDNYTFPAAAGATSHSMYKNISSAVTPSATANTFGATVTQSPDATFIGVVPTAVSIVTTGVGTETVTIQSTVTWNDSTTTLASISTTANGTINLSASQLISMLSGGDGRYATSIAWASKSSIASSAASQTVTVLGLNQS